MTSLSRSSIFHAASQKLIADFEDARNNVPHKGSAGGEGEKIISKFLADHLPHRFGVTNGFILDKSNNVSGQTDVIIYDALNCPVYRTSSTEMIIPSDNAAAVFEVKFNLNVAGLKNDIEKIHNVKNLIKTPLPAQDPQYSIKSTFGVIFAFESSLSDDSIFRAWNSKLIEPNKIHNSCNMIVILNRGIYIPIIKFTNGDDGPITLDGIPNAPPQTEIGLAFLNYGDRTLDHMLRLLLADLTFFRHRVDHPGFEFSAPLSQTMFHLGTYNQDGKLDYK